MNPQGDPLVAEVRRASAANLARFNNDLNALFAHFTEREEKAVKEGYTLVSYPAVRVERNDMPPAKRAG